MTLSVETEKPIGIAKVTRRLLLDLLASLEAYSGRDMRLHYILFGSNVKQISLENSTLESPQSPKEAETDKLELVVDELLKAGVFRQRHLKVNDTAKPTTSFIWSLHSFA